MQIHFEKKSFSFHNIHFGKTKIQRWLQEKFSTNFQKLRSNLISNFMVKVFYIIASAMDFLDATTLLMVTASNKLSYTENKQTLFLFPILLILVQPTTIDAWLSSQVLYVLLGRSSNAGIGAEDQHSLIVPKRC